MGWFRTLFVFDALALLVLLYFFVDGLRYAPTGDYFSTWAPVLGIPMAGMALAWALKSSGKTGAAIAILTILSLPVLLYLLFMLMLIVLQPNWH